MVSSRRSSSTTTGNRYLAFRQAEPVEEIAAKHPDLWFDNAAAVRHALGEDLEYGDLVDWFRARTYRACRYDSLLEECERVLESSIPVPTNVDGSSRTAGGSDQRIGDLVRGSILDWVQNIVPGVTDITTGPTPVSTDRVVVEYDPAQADVHYVELFSLCHPVILGKLCELGYGPVELSWRSTVFGRDDIREFPARRIEFRRGEALADWFAQTQSHQQRTDLEMVDTFAYYDELDWEPYIRGARVVIASPYDLWERGEFGSFLGGIE